MGKKTIRVSASFKDPSGYVFSRNGKIFRRVNPVYFSEYNQLVKSGLYRRLTVEKLLIPHKLISQSSKELIIQPLEIPFISYPYEWCFNQLKDAAITTLKVQKLALDYGMSLKDASAYNIQFLKGQPVLIDTLSFEKYDNGQGWHAYRQFCMHFLSPLLLMSVIDIRLNKLLQIYLDGIPLDLTSSLLNYKSWLNLGALIHIKAHAKAEHKFSKVDLNKAPAFMKLQDLYGLVEHLDSTTRKLNFKNQITEWSNYYQQTNYSKKALSCKAEIVKSLIKQVNPKIIWDLGANDGTFSRLVSDKAFVVSFDIDSLAVDYNYRFNKVHKNKNCLPLLLDITNPSPGLGWANQERVPWFKRGSADLIMALALIHHLVISYNLNFAMIADLFSRLAQYLIIEFIPKEDSQVQRLLRNRKDIFTHYNQSEFEQIFKKRFNILSVHKIKDCQRTIYLMKTK